ncbi:MAG: PaaI family thioesterase [Polyangiaceae bacterium]|nr:PaaI family thioesterase [Polyangiaceae bacterium]
MQPSLISAEAFTELVREHMHMGDDFRFGVLELERGRARIGLEPSERFRRPGGTISGPTLFTLADLTLWAAVLSEIGIQAMAVTSDMTLHFLRRPRLKAMVCEAQILKVGRKLVHGDIRIWLADESDVVCHATGTYARPETKTETP